MIIKMESKYLYFFSGGKDSTVGLHDAVKAGYKIDDVICAILPFEEPDMFDHINNVNKWYFKQTGKKIIFLENKDPIEPFMEARTKRGKHKGKIRGFPLKNAGFCWISRDWKIELLRKFEIEYKKINNCEIHKYLGFAIDEKNHLRKKKINNYKKGILKFSVKTINKKTGEIKIKNYDISNESYPLVDFDYTEEMCRSKLKEIGLWCQTHFDYNRSGCWCCPKQSKESRLKAINSLKRLHLVEKWCKLSNREIYPDLTLEEIKLNLNV